MCKINAPRVITLSHFSRKQAACGKVRIAIKNDLSVPDVLRGVVMCGPAGV